MRTLTVRKGSGGTYATGWHILTVSGAKYGEYNDAKFLDVWFKDYPENFTLRVYEKRNTAGEEFAIGGVFRFANAGISDALDGPDGNVVIKLDDSAETLVGHQLNVYFHKEGEYSRALRQVAPTVFKNIVEEFTEADVEYWKGRAEKFYLDYVKNSTTGDYNGSTESVTTNGATEEVVPF